MWLWSGWFFIEIQSTRKLRLSFILLLMKLGCLDWCWSVLSFRHCSRKRSLIYWEINKIYGTMIELLALRDCRNWVSIMEELRHWGSCKLMILLKLGFKIWLKLSATYHTPTLLMRQEKYRLLSRHLKTSRSTIKLVQEFRWKVIFKTPETILTTWSK